MSVKFHPVVQIKLILIKKKAHRGISSIQTVTLWDLSLIYFRSMCTGNSHHSDLEPKWSFVYLAGETGVTVPLRSMWVNTVNTV